MSANLEEFQKALLKDPELLKRLQKRSDLDEFRQGFNVTRATPFKCPTCATLYPDKPSLWYNPNNPKRFVCRRCHLIWTIICETISNEELILKIKQIEKEA